MCLGTLVKRLTSKKDDVAARKKLLEKDVKYISEILDQTINSAEKEIHAFYEKNDIPYNEEPKVFNRPSEINWPHKEKGHYSWESFYAELSIKDNIYLSMFSVPEEGREYLSENKKVVQSEFFDPNRLIFVVNKNYATNSPLEALSMVIKEINDAKNLIIAAYAEKLKLIN